MRNGFKSASVAFVSCMLMSGAGVFAQSMTATPTTKPTTAPAARRPLAHLKGPPDMPDSKHYSDGTLEPRFKSLHESFLARGKSGPIGVLFLGDSITEGWKNAKPVWEKYFGKYQPADFGIGGDRTEHVLWRIDNGELDGISPKVLVLLIGTNNVSGNCTAYQIIKADTKIVDEIHQKLPDTKVLIMAIFPRGHDPKDPKMGAWRAEIDAINVGLAKLDGTPNTRYLNINSKFLDENGLIQPDIMKDYLHPTPKGYEIWAAAMQPTLDEMMK